MFTIVTVIHIIACLVLIGVVLLQQGKGADMGAVFGGSSSTIFGSSGAGNFLTRLTTGMAVVFMLTSLTLTYASARNVTSTVFDKAPLPEPPPLEQPAAPGAEPQAAAPAGEAQPLQVELAQPEGGQPAAGVQAEVGGAAQVVETGGDPQAAEAEAKGNTGVQEAVEAAEAAVGKVEKRAEAVADKAVGIEAGEAAEVPANPVPPAVP